MVAAALGVREQPGAPLLGRWPGYWPASSCWWCWITVSTCSTPPPGCARSCRGPVMTCGSWRPAGRVCGWRGRPGTGWARWRCPIPVTWLMRPRPRRWRCSWTGPAGPTRTSPWMVRPGRRWRGWWRGWMGCRWRSSWPRPGPRRWGWASCWTVWMTGSRCWPAGTGGRRPGSGRWPRPWNGATSCWTNRSGGPSGRCRCSPGRSPWREPRRWPGRAPGLRCCAWWTARCWSRRGPAWMGGRGT